MIRSHPHTYERVRYISDKHMVVFDIGNAYTKFGYAGEPSPRKIIRTEVRCPETKRVRRVLEHGTTTEELYQLLVEFFNVLFFKYVMISPKDARILFLESPLVETRFRETLARVMFRHFEVGSLLFLPSHLATISTLGVETALVFDVGYQDATLIPVYEGVPILKAWQSLPLGGEIIHECMRHCLYEDETEKFDDISEKILEDIKVQTCFVTTLERSAKLKQKDFIPSPSVKYPGLKMTISGKLREQAYEVLWDREYMNLPTMVLEALLECPLDTRRVLTENIILIGGTTMAKGFASRLKEELLDLVKSDQYKNRLKIQTFKFHTAPCKPNYTAWLGGAIFGTTDLPLRCVTKEMYLRTNRIPDWCSLLDNQKDESNHSI